MDSQSAREVEVAERRIAVLGASRAGAAAAAVVAAALWSLGATGAGAAATALIASALLSALAHARLRGVLRECAAVAQLARVRAVERTRARLRSARRRRAVADSLRGFAACTGGASRFEVTDHARRVPLVRCDLLALADELDAAQTVDVTTMVALDELLCDGSLSPLLNGSRPVTELVESVGRLRFRLAAMSAGGGPAGVELRRSPVSRAR